MLTTLNMMGLVTKVNCSLLLRSFLAWGAFGTTSAFVAKRPSLKSPRQRLILPIEKNCEVWTCRSRESLLQKRHKSVAHTSFSHLSVLRMAPKIFGTIELDDVLYDDVSTAFDAWEWTNGMGAPAALVAGAVLVTLSETRTETAPKPQDKSWIRFTKQMMRFLLMSSFALEVASIFVANMTGSVLLGKGPQASNKLVGYMSPLQLLHHHHE